MKEKILLVALEEEALDEDESRKVTDPLIPEKSCRNSKCIAWSMKKRM